MGRLIKSTKGVSKVELGMESHLVGEAIDNAQKPRDAPYCDYPPNEKATGNSTKVLYWVPIIKVKRSLRRLPLLST